MARQLIIASCQQFRARCIVIPNAPCSIAYSRLIFFLATKFVTYHSVNSSTRSATSAAYEHASRAADRDTCLSIVSSASQFTTYNIFCGFSTTAFFLYSASPRVPELARVLVRNGKRISPQLGPLIKRCALENPLLVIHV